MKESIIRDLEALINEEDTDKIKEIRQSIANGADSLKAEGLSETIMHKINIYTDTPNEESKMGIRSVIQKIKDS